MTIGTLFALAAAVAYGASDFIGGVGSRRFSPWQLVVVGQCAGAAVMVATGLALPGQPSPVDFAWATLAGAGSATGSLFLYRGLARGRMGLVAPLSAVGAAVLPVFAGLVFGERPGLLVWIGIILALPGIWLVSRDPGSDRPGRRGGGVADGVLAGVGFGVLFIAVAQIADDAGFLPLAANQAVGAALTILAASMLKEMWRPSRAVLGWGSAAGVLGALGTLAFLVASGTADLAITGVLASLYPAVTVVLAALLLGERVGIPQQAGIGICTLAVAAIALG